MTSSAPAVPARGSSAVTALAGRGWKAPLFVHALALLALLVLGLALTAPRVAYMSDEAAALVQARQLEAGAGWYYRYPLASIDSEDAARPFVRADAGTKGVAPYAKHPLYPVVLAGAIRVGGDAAVAALSLVAAVAAAVVAALLTRRLDPRLDRVALWLVGIGSPLLFDSYLVLAHGLSAAVAGVAMLAAVVALGPTTSSARRWVVLPAALVALAVAAMLRTEAVFLGPSLAIAVAVLMMAKRVPRARGLALVVVGLSGATAGWLVDHVVARAIVGTAYAGVPNVAPSSWIAGRIQAVQTTWFAPSQTVGGAGDLLLVVGLLLLTVGAVLIRRGDRRQGLLIGLLVVAVACYAGRAIVGPPGAIPGLALAFPAGWFLLWLVGRRVLEGVRLPMMAGVAVLSCVGVLLTEYAIGGGIEWGGRYFAFILPVIVPVLLLGAVAAIERQRPDVRTAVFGSLTVITLVVAFLAVQSVRHTHVVTAQLLDGISQQSQIAGPSGPLDRPVVISTSRLLPQLDSRDFDRYDWVVPDLVNLRRYSDRLVDLGVRRAVLVSSDPTNELADMPGWQIVSRSVGLHQEVVVVEHG